MLSRIITAHTMADLLAKVYAAEGWVRAFGESKTARAKAAYDLGINHKGNRFTATRKEAA